MGRLPITEEKALKRIETFKQKIQEFKKEKKLFYKEYKEKIKKIEREIYNNTAYICHYKNKIKKV